MRPTEIRISAEALGMLLAAGSTISYYVEDGPSRGAHIVGVRWESDLNSDHEPRAGWVVLEYDRPVQPCKCVNSWGSPVLTTTGAST